MRQQTVHVRARIARQLLVCLTSECLIDVDGTEYTIRRPGKAQWLGIERVFIQHELDGIPLSIHRLNLYWAGRESSFVRWHGGLGDGKTELIVNYRTRQRTVKGGKLSRSGIPCARGAFSDGLSINRRSALPTYPFRANV
jgi:hypothetical protein